MFFFRYLHEAQQLAANISDWENSRFHWEKAFVACVFSAAAYEEMPRFELKSAKRAKVIPCDGYQANFARAREEAKEHSLSRLETDQTFAVIIRDRIVVVVTKVQNVVFIALRGTTLSFSDFKADLDARKVRYPVGWGDSVRLHRGFLDAVLDCFDEVMERVVEVIDPGNPIYVTGHSLGGAMAAIFYAKLERAGAYPHQYNNPATACYTFGMPRFGDLSAKSLLPSPYHVFNQFDAVPTVPPTFLGFADCGTERCIDARPAVVTVVSKGNAGFRRSKGIATLLGISDHRMERYLERLDALRSA
jgi:hypothetical protein